MGGLKGPPFLFLFSTASTFLPGTNRTFSYDIFSVLFQSFLIEDRGEISQKKGPWGSP